MGARDAFIELKTDCGSQLPYGLSTLGMGHMEFFSKGSGGEIEVIAEEYGDWRGGRMQ